MPYIKIVRDKAFISSKIEIKSLPVLIEPVINLGLSVKGITEVGRSG
jgi:hypothetical protein